MSEVKEFRCYLCAHESKTNEYREEKMANHVRILGKCPICEERYDLKVYSDARKLFHRTVCDQSVSDLYKINNYDIPKPILFSSLKNNLNKE